MKKALLLLFTLLFAVMSAWAQNTYTVCASGCDYTSIQAAINAASADDVIIVAAGTYVENVIVNKSLDIHGANFGIAANDPSDPTLVNPARVGESLLNGTFTLQVSNITIDGFAITGPGFAVQAPGTGQSSITLRNNNMYSNTGGRTIEYWGPAQNATDWTLTNNRITDVQATDATAITLFNITGLTISNNTILHTNDSYNGRRGLNLDGCRTITMSGNYVNLGLVNPAFDNSDGSFTKARYPLQLSASFRSVTNVTVSANNFGGAYDGIITLGNGVYENISLSSNVLSNVVLGIRFQAGTNVPVGSLTDIFITNNTIGSSNRCIYLQDGTSGSGTADPYTNIDIHNNTLLRNTAGIALEVHSGAIVTDSPVDATCNWWGSADASVIAAKISGPVDWSPFWTTSTGPCDGEAPFTNSTTGLSYATLQAALDAATNGQTVTVNVAGTYGGITFNTGLSVALTNSSGGIVTFVGASPALTVTSGTLTVSGMSYTTATNDPTILINGGTLNISDCSIEASTGFDNAGIRISSGTLNAGTSSAHGGNTFIYDSAGDKAIDNQTGTACGAIGNYWGSIIYPEFIIRLSGPVNFDPWCNSDFSVCTYSLLTPGPVTYAPKWIRPAGTVVVPITVTNFNNVMAVSLKLGYTTSQLTYGSIAPGPGVPSSGWLFTDIGGVIAISYQATSGFNLADNAVLLNVTFTYAGTAQGDLTWIETDPSGTDLEYTNAVTQAPYYDIPNANYYINGYITNGTLTFTREYPGYPVGQTDQTIEVVHTGGTGSYTYLWTGPNSKTYSTKTIIPDDGYGNYTVVVTDINGATISGTYYFGPVHNINTYIDYDFLKDAVLAGSTLDEHTITMDPGTYIETGQIVINKNLTVIGSGMNATTIKPSGDTGGSGDPRGWFLVNPDKTFNLSYLTLDGAGYKIHQGIRHKGKGTIDHVKFQNILYEESGPSYAGTAVAAFGGTSSNLMNVNVTYCEFANIGRVGILYFGTGINGSVYDHNTYTGKGTGNWLDYAVEMGAGAIASVTNSYVSGNLGIASVDGSKSAAFIVSDYFAPGVSTTATITGCELTNNRIGIALGILSTDVSAVVAHSNKIYGNVEYGALASGSTVSFDASPNWWGDPTGPYHATNPCGLGNAVSDHVDFDPWYFQEGMTTLNGLPALTLSAIPNISTITATPIVVSVTVNYPDLTGYDPAVLADAVISTTETSFPVGTEVIEVIYTDGANPSVYIPVSYDLSTGSTHFLSDILGNPSPYGTPLVAHSNKSINWKLIIEGAASPIADFPVSIQSISYLDRGVCLNALGDPKSFTVTFADVDFDYTTNAPLCFPDDVEVDWTEYYPLVANVDPTRVLNDSRWEFYSDAGMTNSVALPANTIIKVYYNDVVIGTSTLSVNASHIYGSAVVANQADPTTNQNGYIIPLERPATVTPVAWKIELTGAPAGLYYIKVKNIALLTSDASGWPYEEYPYDVQNLTVNYIGAADVALLEILPISTVTSTPVIVPVTVTYPDLAAQNIDPSVLTDARISTGDFGGFPDGAKIIKIKYQGSEAWSGNFPIAGFSEFYLSQVLGTATPLLNHSGMTVNWEITIAGIEDDGIYNTTIEAIAYLTSPYGTPAGCYSVMDTESFTVTLADATLALTATPPLIACDPDGFFTIPFDLTHPTIANNHPSILSNATILSDKLLPAGTKISWIYDVGGPTQSSGTFTVGTATYLLYLSEIVTNTQGNTTGHASLGHSGLITWQFQTENLDPGTYNFVIKAIAQLDGVDYPYATMTPALKLINVGADGVDVEPIASVSTLANTPVIIPVTVTYPDLYAQAVDPSVLTDARITTTFGGGFPAGARIFKITYEGGTVYTGSYDLAGKTEVFLSEILGPPAPTPLLGHSGAEIDWEVFIDGISAPVTVPVKIEAIAYVDKDVCYSVMDSEEFSLTYAYMDVFTMGSATNPAQIICDEVTFTFEEDFPAIVNVDVRVLSNAKITVISANPIPAGTTIAWSTTFGSGTYNVTSPTTTLYVSDMLGFPANPLVGESNSVRTWTFTLSGADLDQHDYDLKIDGLAQLDGADYVYATTYQYLKGLPTVALSAIGNISTITKTPVVIHETVTYPAAISALDQVLTDALISSSVAFPTGAKIESVTYDEGSGATTFPVNYPMVGETSVYLSDILGSASPLNGHAGLTVNWTFTLSGIDEVFSSTISFTPVAYIDKNVCVSQIGTPVSFALAFNALVAVSLTPDPAQVMCDEVELTFSIEYPAITNIDNGTGVINNNALISSNNQLPASILNWSFNGTPGTPYPITAGTLQLYLSEVTGMTAPLQGHGLRTDVWVFQLVGTGLADLDYVFTIDNMAQLNPDYIYNTSTSNVTGLPEIALGIMDDISTITATPVIITEVVTYPATISSQDNVLTDARFNTSVAFPTGAVVETVTYDEGSGPVIFPVNYSAFNGVITEFYLSEILGLPATPLNGHAGLTITWTFTVSGFAAPYTGTINITPVAYIDKNDCETVIGNLEDFILTFADASMSATTTMTDVCYPAPLAFNAVITYPMIQNLNTAVLTDAYITSDYIFPIGTMIKWGYNAPPAVTYTLTAAASSLYLSDITGMSAPLQGHSGTDTWYFELSNAGSPIYFDLTIQPVARLNGNNYPYTDGDILDDLLVKNCNISGTLKYNNPGKTPMNGVTLTLSPSGISAVTDINGVFTLDIVPNGAYTINIDNLKAPGSINATDAAQVNYWGTTSSYPIEYVKFLAGDVYGDGTDPNYTINATDASHIQLRFVNGPGYAFDRLPWVYWKANDPVTANTNKGNVINVTVDNANVSQNLLGQVTGDFNSSYLWNPTKDMAANVHLTYSGSKQADANTAAELSLRMVGAAELSAVSLVFHYPEELMTVLEVTMKDNPGRLDWALVGNELRIGWNAAAAVSFADGEELLIIRLQTSGFFFQGNTIQLALTADPINELADGNLNIIPGAGLSIDMLESSTLGTGDLPIVNALSLTSRPNPFGSYTHLIYALPADGHVMLFVSDMTGRRLALLVDELAPAGTYQVKLDGLPLEPGVYSATMLLKTSNGDLTRTVKLIRAW